VLRSPDRLQALRKHASITGNPERA
jgi:hypothetical protein